AATGPAVDEDDRLAARVARLLVVNRVDRRDAQRAAVVRLDVGVETPAFHADSYTTCGCGARLTRRRTRHRRSRPPLLARPATFRRTPRHARDRARSRDKIRCP